MPRTAVAEPTEFEKQRLANIAERDALLKKLQQEAGGLVLKASSSGLSGVERPANTKKKGPPAKRVKKEEDFVPRRTSSRLAGIQADSEVAREKAEKEYVEAKEADRIKRQRVTGDLNLGDTSLIGTDTLLKGNARPYERTFDDEDIKETADKDLKALRKKMSSLEIWDAWEPTRIKITPERIYSMAFHPTTSAPIVFAGDKLGNLGIVNASQRNPRQAKEEEDVEVKKERKSTVDNNPGDRDQDEDEDEDADPDPIITTIKPHTRTISAMFTHPSKPEALYTASYDSSIRSIDLSKSIATEIYGPADSTSDEPVSGIDMAATDPQVVYFTTLSGVFGRHDTRSPSVDTETYQLSEKKIGGFTLHPTAPHYLATASLDRHMRLWDLRKITKKLPTLVGEHESKLSVSHAAFNTVGQVATSSYDDTIKIHSFGVGNIKGGTDALESMNKWKAGFQLGEEVMRPEVVVRHNNQVPEMVLYESSS